MVFMDILYYVNIVACLLKARIVDPAETAVARERLCKCHVSLATVAHTTIEVLLGMVFSMWSAPTTMSPNKATARRGVSRGVRLEAISGLAVNQ
jgi:hypothetical protein